MPLFPFSEQGLDPHLPFAEGFLVGWGGSIALGAVEVSLIKGAEDLTPLFALCTVGFDWTAVAGVGIGLIDPEGTRVHMIGKRQFLALGTAVEIALGIIRKAFWRIASRPATKIWGGQIG